MIAIKDITKVLEDFAPLSYQESYDNAGLITGSHHQHCTGAIICLDAIEAVVDEAIEKECNLIIAHHPIVFSGLKTFTGKTYIERVIIKAIKNDIAIYAAHTNLDNVTKGVNAVIAEKLGLLNCQILEPKKGLLKKLYSYVPDTHLPQVMEALFKAGAGKIGDYADCGFFYPGTGTYRGNESSHPFIGEKESRITTQEQKLEVIFQSHLQYQVIQALLNHHPYEEVAYEVVALDNTLHNVGSGMIGSLPQPVESKQFLQTIKQVMKTSVVKYTHIHQPTIQKVAICGGSGSFLLSKAKSSGADIFITADFKYHQFFDAEEKIIIADIGHYESEQYTSELFYQILKEKFPNFALHLTNVNTNPVNYL